MLRHSRNLTPVALNVMYAHSAKNKVQEDAHIDIQLKQAQQTEISIHKEIDIMYRHLGEYTVYIHKQQIDNNI